MKIVGDIPHSKYKITLFQWNGKFQMKVEDGAFEQIFKVPEGDYSIEGVKNILDDEFLQGVEYCFTIMQKNLQHAVSKQ